MASAVRGRAGARTERRRSPCTAVPAAARRLLGELLPEFPSRFRHVHMIDPAPGHWPLNSLDLLRHPPDPHLLRFGDGVQL